MDYFDVNLDLTEEEFALKEAAHKFAREVMRPISRELDLMTADEAAAPDSPLPTFLAQAYDLGYHKILLPDDYGGLGMSPLQAHLVFEELGWGSVGLAVLLGVACFPFYLMCLTGDEDLTEKYVRPFCECRDGGVIGCWAVTEPDHGSDVMAEGEPFFASPEMRGNVRAQLVGDEWVIDGQKSAWVSGGTIATHALLHCQIDPSLGMAGYGICVVPLDLDGISRGRPLRKMGQRDLNQGEIFFDAVKIPRNLMFVEPDFYIPALEMILAAANAVMSVLSTGLARAAFEEAFTYAKQRVQGGRPIIEHYSMKQRLFGMFANVEMARCMSRAALNLNLNISPPLPEYSLAAKIKCTQACFDNAHEAIQILGGNGLTQEYIVEKLFRDARAALIETGRMKFWPGEADIFYPKRTPGTGTVFEYKNGVVVRMPENRFFYTSNEGFCVVCRE